ncbi:hypothetical protein [Corynebacterium ureicelerivorans]|uniref:DUF732 domain-containing protein n=1 Tax=Corynebacterium ureicelerivorans TaxID=401472 RepID=A0A077HSF1_9CORY|nr:hypothetical protein [Corynebacterium ureicelerivorans]AIL97637.1 hypothetical protein CUREI_10455 [Corynebacterium ureicelerivorans]
MRKIAGCLATITSAAALAGCGGATVDSDDVTETATATSTSETTETASSSTVVERSSSAGGGASDQPAREVTEVPQQASAFTPAEEAYLAGLRENGVNIDGVEDQLTATGATVCEDDLITRDAVAGQLVEQRRTDMDAAGVATLIDDTARANLCS